MDAWLSELFKAHSSVSSIRVMAMISLFIGGAIGFYGAYANHDVTALVAVFVSSAFLGKVSQKFAEAKDPKDEPKS